MAHFDGEHEKFLDEETVPDRAQCRQQIFCSHYFYFNLFFASELKWQKVQNFKTKNNVNHGNSEHVNLHSIFINFENLLSHSHAS